MTNLHNTIYTASNSPFRWDSLILGFFATQVLKLYFANVNANTLTRRKIIIH